MPLFLIAMLIRIVVEVVRLQCRKAKVTKPETLCARCLYAHVQYAANARRAISCAYGGTVRAMKLDVLYCTDYQARDLPVRPRVIGFVQEIAAAK